MVSAVLICSEEMSEGISEFTAGKEEAFAAILEKGWSVWIDCQHECDSVFPLSLERCVNINVYSLCCKEPLSVRGYSLQSVSDLIIRSPCQNSNFAVCWSHPPKQEVMWPLHHRQEVVRRK